MGQRKLQDIDRSSLKHHIVMVPQEPAIFHESLLFNITLGREGIEIPAIEKVITESGLQGFVDSLSDGLQTTLQEGGLSLSSGQRQLLSFARALAYGADILILDEATSSIDAETEALIQHGIHVLMEGKTAIAIAHRLSTIRDVDRIYVLHRGKLIEQGRHDELLALRGVYERLYRLQSEAAVVAPESRESA